MAAQLKINATSPVSLKEMSGTDYDYTTYQILNTFAASDTGVGTISVNPGVTTGLTSIGTFTDTYYDVGPVGAHPVGTSITSTTSTFYQDLQSAAESLTRPIEYNSGLKEQIDANLNADSITVALANLVANGQGSYALTPTTPTGGTWVSKATITNYQYAATTNVTYLWRKTAPASVPSALRPLKINSTSPVSVKEMSDAEIQTLTARFRNQIVSTGIGKYVVQTSAPVSGGTWITQGAAFSDTRNTESNQNYSGIYTGNYSGTYTGSYTQAFTGNYTGSFSGTYTGSYSRAFSGAYSRAFAGSYTGAYQYYDPYSGAGPGGTYIRGYYTGYYTAYYTGFYTGSFSGNYTGSYSRVFTGNYTGSFSGNYSGTYTGNYTGSYTGMTLDATTATISTVSLWLRTA